MPDHPSTFVNFPYSRETFLKFLTTFRPEGRPFHNYCLHNVQPGDFPSSFINLPCSWKTFLNLCQLSMWLEDLPSTSSTLRAPERPSVIFCQRSVQLGDLKSIFVNILFGWENFCKLSSAFYVARFPSVNFPCS